MSRNLFLDGVKNLINASLAEQGMEDETIILKCFDKLSRKSTTDLHEEQFSAFLKERKINYLVHFTHIDNLENILKIGLIPRKYLEDELIQIKLRPRFSDNQRRDGNKEANCLSVSFPNYRMFFKKSKHEQDEWAVIFFNLNLIKKHRCKFASTNLAYKDSKPIEGIEGAEQMFADLNLRERLDLPSYYTTNPQAEVLEYSVVPNLWIKEVHLYSNKHMNKVVKWNKRVVKWNKNENIIIKVDRTYFSPRKDHRYWSLKNRSHNNLI